MFPRNETVPAKSMPAGAKFQLPSVASEIASHHCSAYARKKSR
jgi:hypothetical protein